jgi:hypothetical protein
VFGPGRAYELLTPYRDLPVTPSLAVTCFGSVQRVLGLAALTVGDRDRAAEHLDHALRANRLLGHRPATAITMADLAEVLARRGGGSDRARATQLLAKACAEADTMGMQRWSAVWRRRLVALASRDATISREGRHWVLAVGERQAVVPDRLGLRYLAQLLTSPDRPVAALQLAAGEAASMAAGSAGQPTLDRRAHAAYRQRVSELTDQLGQARAGGDRVAAERARGELDFLFDELRRTTGRGGRPRSFPDQRERARTAVQKAIKRAIAEIGAVEPDIGALLATTVATGATCCYRPDPEQPVQWRYADRR